MIIYHHLCSRWYCETSKLSQQRCWSPTPAAWLKGKIMNQILHRQYKQLRPTWYKNNTALWFSCRRSSYVSAKKTRMRAVRSWMGDAQELCSPRLSLSHGKGQQGSTMLPESSGAVARPARQWGHAGTPQGSGKGHRLRDQIVFKHLNTNKFHDREYLAEDSSSEMLFDRKISLQKRPEAGSEQWGCQVHTGDGLKPINFTSKQPHFSFDLTSWFVFLLFCVTSKNLAIESYNKAHRMPQNYKTSEKVTTFYCLSNKRWHRPRQDKGTVEQFKTVKLKANLGKEGHFLVRPASPLPQYPCTWKAAHQYNHPFCFILDGN